MIAGDNGVAFGPPHCRHVVAVHEVAPAIFSHRQGIDSVTIAGCPSPCVTGVTPQLTQCI